MKHSTIRAVIWIALAAFAFAVPAARSAGYPDHPVRLIVSYPPGGTNDIVARIVAQKLSTEFGQSFIVENRSGANGIIGTGTVARAEPDGYTLLVASSAPTTVGATLLPNLTYDIRKDFIPISLIAEVDVVLVANPSVKANTFPELIQWARQNPGRLRVALGGYGSVAHMLIESIRLSQGISTLVVPYKGTGPALVDLVAGRVDVDYENLPATIAYIRAGKLKPIVAFSSERTPLLPNVPTIAEQGMPELVAAPWFGLMAPAGTPASIVQKLANALHKVLDTPQSREQFARIGAHVKLTSPAATRQFVLDDYARWAKLIKKAKIEM